MHNISQTESFYLNEGYRNNFKINQSLSVLLPLRFILASSPEGNSLWNKLVNRYHYLGYSRIPGKRLKYLIFSHDNLLLAAIGWKSGSCQLVSRDAFIGWSPSCRERNQLEYLINIVAILENWIIFNPGCFSDM